MHNEIITIGKVTIYGYGLMIGIGILCAYLLSEYRAKKQKLDSEPIFNIAIVAVLFGFLSAKLLYIITVFDKILSGQWGHINIRDGFVVYGGIIGGIISVLIYCRIKKLHFLTYMDLVIPAVALAQGFGRIGCFLAGCCYGKVCDTIFSVYYTNPIGGAPVGVPVFPVQLMEAALNLVLFAILLIYTRKRIKAFSVLFVYLIGYSIVRFSTELMRDDEIRGIFLGLSTSQWISILLFVVGVVGLILMRTHENKKYALEDAQNAAGSQAVDSETEISSSSVDAAAPAEAESDSADADSSTQDIQDKLEE